MIYSGGDDVLALLPAPRTVECAVALRYAFRGEEGDTSGWIERDGWQLLTMGNQATLSAWIERDGWQLLTMGNQATLSAGIAFVHFMEDLRLALEAARAAEKAAKEGGRDWMRLCFMRRSGEHSKAGLSWDLAAWFQELVSIFAGGATDRWTYRLRQELRTLQGNNIPDAAVAAEIRRLVDRAECTRLASDRHDENLLAAFGPETGNASDHAGAVAFSDARILAFPVHSLTGVFAWVTCRDVLDRLSRDLALVGGSGLPDVPAVEKDKAACIENSPLLAHGECLMLEEFEFSRDGDAREVADWIASRAVEDAGTRRRLRSHLAVLHNDDFTHFAHYATEETLLYLQWLTRFSEAEFKPD